jgi:hypothetical protein
VGKRLKVRMDLDFPLREPKIMTFFTDIPNPSTTKININGENVVSLPNTRGRIESVGRRTIDKNGE